MRIRTQITLPIILLVSLVLTLAFFFLTFVVQKSFEEQYFEHLQTTANLKEKSLKSLLQNIESEALSWSYGLRKQLIVDTVENNLIADSARQAQIDGNLVKDNWFLHLEIVKFDENESVFTRDPENEAPINYFLESGLIDVKVGGFTDILLKATPRIGYGEGISYRVDKFDVLNSQSSNESDEIPVNAYPEDFSAGYFFYTLPIIQDAVQVGIALFEIDLSVIDELLEDRVGLGVSGETYLVGRDRFMRSNSRFTEESTRMVQRVDTLNVDQCFLGDRMDRANLVFDDYRPVKVLGNHSYIEKLDWCLLSEIDFDEAQQVPRLIGASMLLSLLILLLLLWFGVNLVGFHIAQPIVKLAGVFNAFDGDSWNLEIPMDKSTQEIDDLKEAFQHLLNIISQNNMALTGQSKRLETIVDSLGEGLFVLDAQKNIVLFNTMASEISDFSEKSVLGKKYSKTLDFIDDSTQLPIPDLIEVALETGGIEHFSKHLLLRTKTGRKVPVSLSAAPLRDEDNNLNGCVVVFRDVSKEHEIDRMKTEFVSIASHQLRTPVTAIRWLLELLQGDSDYKKLSDTQTNYLEQIEMSADRMIHLVDDLLDVSRIETGRKFAITKKTKNVRECLDEGIQGNQALAAKKKITLEVEDLLPAKIMLPIDQPKILQVFHNFISNAIKYSSDKSTVKISGWMKNDEWVFCVSDNGIGIPADEKVHIFEKFYRASNSQKTKNQGTGLGLYIARRIVEGHGGQVWFESQKSQGANFYFSIPKT